MDFKKSINTAMLVFCYSIVTIEAANPSQIRSISKSFWALASISVFIFPDFYACFSSNMSFSP